MATSCSAGPLADQVPGEPARGRVKLGVGKFRCPADQGRGIRGALGLVGEQVAEGDGRRPAGRGCVQAVEYMLPFGRVEHVEVAERHMRVGRDEVEHPQQPGGDRGGGVVVEQVAGVLEVAVDPACPLGEGERQVELGGAGGHRPLGSGQPGAEVEAGLRCVVHREHDLEQRVAGERAERVEQLDQALERDVLVGEGGEVGFPDPAEYLGERRAAGQVGAQDEGVDEEPDQVIGRVVGAPGDGGADGDVIAGAQAGQEHGERRLGEHEEGHPVLARQGGEPGPGRRGDREGDGAALVGGRGRPGPVGGQGELFREASERAPPVGGLPGELAGRVVFAAEQAPLPQGVVGVLGGERGPGWPAAREPGLIGGAEVREQRPGGPGVRGDVVHHHKQQVPAAAPDERGAERDLGREVERPRRGRRRQFLGLPGQAGVDDLDDRDSVGKAEDLLPRVPFGVGKDGAERFVPGAHVSESSGERSGIDRPGERERERDVVDRRGPSSRSRNHSRCCA